MTPPTPPTWDEAVERLAEREYDRELFDGRFADALDETNKHYRSVARAIFHRIGLTPEHLEVARAVEELEAMLDLHTGLEVDYLVDWFGATITANDGASTKASGMGETVASALCAAVAAAKEGEDD